MAGAALLALISLSVHQTRSKQYGAQTVRMQVAQASLLAKRSKTLFLSVSNSTKQFDLNAADFPFNRTCGMLFAAHFSHDDLQSESLSLHFPLEIGSHFER